MRDHNPQQMPQIIITYPDGDGELHIYSEKETDAWKFSFTYRQQGTKWETLVQAARDILRANDIMNSNNFKKD